MPAAGQYKTKGIDISRPGGLKKLSEELNPVKMVEGAAHTLGGAFGLTNDTAEKAGGAADTLAPDSSGNINGHHVMSISNAKKYQQGAADSVTLQSAFNKKAASKRAGDMADVATTAALIPLGGGAGGAIGKTALKGVAAKGAEDVAAKGAEDVAAKGAEDVAAKGAEGAAAKDAGSGLKTAEKVGKDAGELKIGDDVLKSLKGGAKVVGNVAGGILGGLMGGGGGPTDNTQYRTATRPDYVDPNAAADSADAQEESEEEENNE